jgi:hypothetical protein
MFVPKAVIGFTGAGIPSDKEWSDLVVTEAGCETNDVSWAKLDTANRITGSSSAGIVSFIAGYPPCPPVKGSLSSSRWAEMVRSTNLFRLFFLCAWDFSEPRRDIPLNKTR